MFNGRLTTRIGIPSFLTTLAMIRIAKGMAMWISETAAVPILSPGYSWLLGGGNIGPIPVLLFWMAILGGIGHIVLRRSGLVHRACLYAGARGGQGCLHRCRDDGMDMGIVRGRSANHRHSGDVRRKRTPARADVDDDGVTGLQLRVAGMMVRISPVRPGTHNCEQRRCTVILETAQGNRGQDV